MQELKLKGKTLVLIDWANVYGWRDKIEIPDIKKIYKYFSNYKECKQIRFYFGKDNNDKSKKFLKRVETIGFKLVTKPVKYIRVSQKPLILKRKCDFDLEIAMDTLINLDKYDSFVFLSGDGDYAPLYTYLFKKRKQVIVIYEKGHIGREIWEIKKGLFKIQFNQLIGVKRGCIKKSSPRLLEGRD